MVGSYVAADYDTNGLGLPGTESWGWQLCDNMGGRVAVGMDKPKAAYDTPSKQGGAERVTLDVTQIPAHSHPSPNGISDSRSGATSSLTYAWMATPPPANTKKITTENAGGRQAHNNMQPFTVLMMER